MNQNPFSSFPFGKYPVVEPDGLKSKGIPPLPNQHCMDYAREYLGLDEVKNISCWCFQGGGNRLLKINT